MVTMRNRFESACVVALAAALVLAAGRAHAAGTLAATLDHDVVRAGDTVRLTLHLDGDGPAAEPDLAPLAADFDVLGTQQSQRITVQNGRTESSREIGIELSPKHAGSLTIPPLHAGAETTAPLTLTVLDASASTSAAPGASAAAAHVRRGDAPGLFVEATVDKTRPFVQGEVHYTVRVYDGVGMREGTLTEPSAPGIRVEQVGDTRTSEQVVNGRRYVVHEREYTLFPQTSGAITVPPLVLEARVPDAPAQAQGSARSPFDDLFGDDAFGDDLAARMLAQMRASGFGSSLLDRMMSPGREVRVRSNPVTLTVQGRPAGAGDGWFLPASAVQLTQSWDPAQPTFRVGETVHRTIELRADGASAEQLPKLVVPEVDGVKQYAGTPEQRTIPQAGGVSAELVQTFDLLPSRAGRFTLPQIDVAWWDVAAQQQRTATLPAETIAPAPAPAAAPAPAPASARPSAQPATANGAAPAAETARRGGPLDGVLAHPVAASAGGVFLLALLLAATWWAARRGRPLAATAALDASRTAARVPARALVDALHQACTANDARAVRAALLAWGRATWPDAPPTSAGAVARRLAHPGLTQAVKALDDTLYAPRAAGFDGSALWRAFAAARKDASGDAGPAPEPLPALYPSSRMA
jgi:hypothetical protein